MIRRLFEKIKEFAKDGLFHIFGGSVVSKIVGVLSTVVVIRQLDKAAYGQYVSANNLFSYFTAFVGIGLANAALQYCSEAISEQKKNGVHLYSLVVGSVSNVLVMALILVLAHVRALGGEPEVAYYLRLMSGLPFVIYIHTYFQIVLRIQMNNRAFSFSSMVYSVSMLGGNILMTMLMGIPGLILSTYLANVFGALKSCHTLKKCYFFYGIIHDREPLERSYKKEMTNYALVYAATTFSSMVLLLLDVTCLDLILKDSTVLADYKVATTIPTACAFIPSCLLVYFYPKMVKAFTEGKARGRAYVNSLMRLFLGVNGAIFVVMVLAAPLLIRLGFGQKYMNTVSLFQLLCLNYLVNGVQMLLSHVLAVIKRLKANLLLSILSGLIKIGMNVALIPLIGSAGAAISTVAVTCLITALYCWYLHKFYKEAE